MYSLFMIIQTQYNIDNKRLEYYSTIQNRTVQYKIV